MKTSAKSNARNLRVCNFMCGRFFESHIHHPQNYEYITQVKSMMMLMWNIAKVSHQHCGEAYGSPVDC
jgi:hypothetical protein